TIREADIQNSNPQTTADLLGSKGGVFIQKSQMGGGSPMIRGFSANRVLLVVDGIRMNNAIYRSGNLHNVISLDAQTLQNVEIIFGPGSVIYGSDALGGVMSFNTLNPKLSTTENTESSGKVFTRYSSANFEKTVHGTFNFGSKKWAGLISSTFTDYENLRMGSHGPDDYLRPEYVAQKEFTGADEIVANKNPQIQKFTAYNQFNLLSKLRYRPNDFFDLTFSAHHSQTSDIPRYDRLIAYRNNQLRYGDWYYGPQKWTLFSGQLQYLKKCVFWDKLNVLAGYQFYEESRHSRNFNSPEISRHRENLSAFSLNVDFGKNFNSQNELFYGLETFFNRVNSTGKAENLITGESSPVAPRYPDGSGYKSMAAYFSYKFIPNEKFVFQTGWRYTITGLNGVFENNFYHFPFQEFDMQNSAFNGSLGIVWHPTSDWQINMNVSSGFRSPNIDDVAKVFDSEPGNVIVPNPKLKPEYAQNFELQVIRSYSNKARIELAGFYTRLKDAMVRRNFTLNGHDSIVYNGLPSNVEALVNAESARVFGGSFAFQYLFTNTIRTKNEFSILNGKDSDDYPLRHVPPTFGSSHLIFDNQILFLDVYVEYSGNFDFEELAPPEQDKPHLYAINRQGNPYSPAWWTLNFKSTWKINKKLSTSAGVENIFDRRYRPYSSGIVAPGINAIISMKAIF
ncbi:MAG TPA: TonB-dependent receptor, partial [Prolixibacteraceae bacterium]|nr:TonB-dependent receptor [Prolixibacteraceae bacterium]